uniref:SEC7 domain-containing protein n=1 Tax=Meloidogyne floridensis TaxID=298350 RepID=A0A915NZH0_9BILA
MTSSFSTVDLTPDEYERLTQLRSRKNQLLDEIQILQQELSKTNSRLETLSPVSNRLPKAKIQKLAISAFNEDYKKGVQSLIDACLVENSAEDFARFLLKNNDLKKSAVGDFLGENEQFNLDVLRHFVCLQNFEGLMLVQAMRNFLSSFRLPGEAQKIDRIMERFAIRFCEQNPSIFDHSDTCYTLCFATIMLNTSLYNPSVKERMSFDDFLNITNSLNQIYNSIREEPFKFPKDHQIDNHLNYNSSRLFRMAEKQGWLHKQGSNHWTWNQRWFVLSNKCLYYFEFPNSREPKGIIPLEGICVRMVGYKDVDSFSSSKKPHTFELYSPNSEIVKAHKTNSEGRLIEGGGQHTAYRMAAPGHEEMHSWISALQRSINKDNAIEEVLERRRAKSVNSGNIGGKEEEITTKNVFEELPTMNEEGIGMGESSSTNNWFNKINSISKSVCGFVGNFKEKIKIKCQNIPKNKIFPIKYLKGAVFCILIITAPCKVDNIYLKPLQRNMTQYGMLQNEFGYERNFFLEFPELYLGDILNLDDTDCKEVEIDGVIYEECNYEMELTDDEYELDYKNNKGEIIYFGNLKKDFECKENEENCEKTYKYVENDGVSKFEVKYEKKNNKKDKQPVKGKAKKLTKIN